MAAEIGAAGQHGGHGVRHCIFVQIGTCESPFLFAIWPVQPLPVALSNQHASVLDGFKYAIDDGAILAPISRKRRQESA